MKYILICLVMAATTFSYGQDKTLKVTSPDNKLSVEVKLTDKLYYSVSHEGDRVISWSPASIEIQGEKPFGIKPVLKTSKVVKVKNPVNTINYKRRVIQDEYNELQLILRDDYKILFRAYNDGVAYRFVSLRKKDFTVTSEETVFNFDSDLQAFIPYVNKPAGASIEEQLWNSFENTYTYTKLSGVDAKRLAFLPVLVELKNGKKLCITEAELENYPGMYLQNTTGKTSLSGYFAAVPKTMERGGHNNLQEIVKTREPFIAKVKSNQAFPWRVMVVSKNDRELSDSDMIYKLASPSRIADPSWVKPGKVAWDWWNDWNIYGVDFVSGVNTKTYQHYIDFASENKIEYVILDEGWAVNLKADLMQVVPEIDLAQIINYAKQKNVGIILWAGYNAFNDDLEKVCSHYAAMGVKGFKVDFMDRDDQPMVNFYYRAAEVAAKYKLMLDFHGAYKPTGMQRTWPNVINFEGVHGLEQMKWSAPTVDQVTYDVTIPFIRMVAGPFDYTQGAMRNASRDSYRPVNSEPMSQGTRCRQLAEYVVFEAPLNMLCDNPSAYRDEPECTSFIAAIPTTWDNTVSLDGKVSEYVAIARQKGDAWYIGAMTNWTERNMSLDLSFLPAGDYELVSFRDGVNANRAAQDYVREIIPVKSGQRLNIRLAPGGGFAGKLVRKQ